MKDDFEKYLLLLRQDPNDTERSDRGPLETLLNKAAGAAISRHLFPDILRLIAELQPPPDPARRREASKGAVSLYDTEIRISDARRADTTGFGVPELHGRRFGLANARPQWQSQPRNQVNVG
jgi:hypothetical protein